MTTPVFSSPPEMARFDPAHDVYRYTPRALQAIFAPRNVAVIGATEKAGSVGRTILWNLISSPFGGTVFPINPKYPGVLGVKAYPKIAAVPDPVDLAVIVTPAATVPGIVGECVEAGVKGAIIISAGFKEIGPQGVELERQILERARQGHMRIVGPNCLGVMNPLTGLNATFASAMARPGNVAFISQSGALCTAVLDWSFREHVGFSAFVSIGSMLDVGWGDLIYYLADDPHTQSIVIYMESIGDARAFLSAAREVALTRPIIILKPGRTEGAARAAASHTGSLTGSDDVLEVAFQRCGVLRVDSISEVFDMAEVLAKQPRPRGPRLTILTNAGGPGVLATDALISSGGQTAELSAGTLKDLNAILPPQWSHNNPIDILGDASPERYARSLEVAASDPDNDGLLVILTPQAMTDPTATAEALRPYARSLDKPLLASWMGGEDVEAGDAILNRTGIPTFDYPDTAARSFVYMWRYSDNLRSLYETPSLPEDTAGSGPDREAAAALLAAARKEGRTLLTEQESKALLAAYGIPTVPTHFAASLADAVRLAGEIGYPVVLKLHSKTITHKSDVGGVQLNLQDAAAVEAAYAHIQTSVSEKHSSKDFLGVTVQPMVRTEGYELILGSSIDSQFGPVLLFGTGGLLVEVYKDSALGLPPLNSTLARQMIASTRIHAALQGVRGRPPVDLEALEALLVRFSQLIVEQRFIEELDINPLLASPDGLLALDARVVIYPREVGEADLPRLAIRPYPIQYVAPWTLKDGRGVLIRPIRAEDEPLVIRFHENISEQTITQRFFTPLGLSQRVAHERMARICHNDYDREIALVVEVEMGDASRIVAVSRLSKLHGGQDEARFTMMISDDFQGQGIGAELLRRIIQIARDEKVARLLATLAPENHAMHKLCERNGFRFETHPETGMVEAELKLV
ncbi:MAG: bifunctional acetate--CoA ligase family protein/GNAT family N-acetyltransferase [Anaerolineales bacterium]|nr:bifunctional acetate--CoA ligase family protein/GNAT family N-acetyltransferase [Anaerolineales bacterium]